MRFCRRGRRPVLIVVTQTRREAARDDEVKRMQVCCGTDQWKRINSGPAAAAATTTAAAAMTADARILTDLASTERVSTRQTAAAHQFGRDFGCAIMGPQIAI